MTFDIMKGVIYTFFILTLFYKKKLICAVALCLCLFLAQVERLICILPVPSKQLDVMDTPVCCASHEQPDHTLLITHEEAFHPFISRPLGVLFSLSLLQPQPIPQITFLNHQHPLASIAKNSLTQLDNITANLCHPQIPDSFH